MRVPMRWLLAFVGAAVLHAQSYVESPVSVCGFVGAARGANEVPAAKQGWGIAGGIGALVRERATGFIAGELNFWYARTLSTDPAFRYATGAIMVDVRARASIGLPLELPTSAFVSAGVGALFPLNEQILQQPPSPEFEPNTPALHMPLSIGLRTSFLDGIGAELRATYVLTTTDNLNAPHDGQFDGFFVLTLGLVVPISY